MKKRISFVIHGLSMGGAEKFLIHLSNTLVKDGFQIDIILLSLNDNLKTEVDKRIGIYYILRKNRYDISVFQRLKKLIKKKNYDIIFSINIYAFFFSKMALLFDKSHSHILSPHTTKPFSTYKYILNFLYCRMIRPYDKIIYLCENQQQYLENVYIYEHDNKEIIYNGVDLKFFDPKIFDKESKRKLKNELGIYQNNKVIVQVARISPEKKHLHSIAALEILHKKYGTKAHLVIVGGGERRLIDKINKYVNKVNLQNFVHLTGNQKDVRPYYNIADLFTLTSESETFPISVLEALSFGIPCVITNIGGVKEIIINGEYGKITKVGNPEEIARDWDGALQETYDQIRIRQYVKDKFNSDKMVNKYKEALTTSDILEN